MSRIVFAAFTAVLVLAWAADTHGPVDFSGTWKMDAERSESAHQAVPIGPVTLVIKQTESDLSLETLNTGVGKTKTQSEVLTFKLDGAESTLTGKDGVPIKTKAHWEGPKLVLGTVRNIQGSTVTTLNVHTLDPKGKEMTVQKTLTVQHGYQSEEPKNSGTGTDVFVKTKASTAK